VNGIAVWGVDAWPTDAAAFATPGVAPPQETSKISASPEIAIAEVVEVTALTRTTTPS
jgi:hypothetical protein